MGLYLKGSIFWDITLCIPGKVANVLDENVASETSVDSYRTTQRCIPKDRILHSLHRENFKSMRNLFLRFRMMHIAI
jgi:hypothetical protein